MIFSYAISQAGPTDIEQHHTLYRRGNAVRDELLNPNSPVKLKETTITRRLDRYAIGRVAPQPGAYEFLFVKTEMFDGAQVYLYDTLPNSAAASSGFVVTQVAIDAERALPRMIAFRTGNGIINGIGTLRYAPAGKYWMPMSAVVTTKIGGKPARERIVWSDYRFPPSLPALTFIR